MANIVGLGSTQDPGADGKWKLRDAPQLQDGSQFRPVELHPAASPVETYAKPAQAPIDHNLQNLAEGLSSLNTNLLGYLRHEQKPAKEEIDKDALAAKYGTMNSSQIAEALKTDPEAQGKLASSFVGSIRASKQGDEFVADWNQKFKTDYDLQNGNFSEDYDHSVAKIIAEQYQGNTPGANAFMERAAGGKRALMDQWIKAKSEQNDYLRGQNTQDGIKTIIRQAVDTDASPQKLMETTANFMRTDKGVMGQGYKRQQEMLLQALDPILNDMDKFPEKRDKYVAAANAIINGDRVGEDGVPRRLADAPEGLGQMAQQKYAEFVKKRNEINDKYLVNETAQYKYNAEAHPELVKPEEVIQFDKNNPGAFKTGEVESILVTREKSLDKAAQQAAVDQADRAVTASKADVSAKDYQAFKEGTFYLPKDEEVPTRDYFLKGDHAATQKFTAEQRKQGVIDLFNKDLEFQKNQLVNSKKMTPQEADNWATGQEIEHYRTAGMAPTSWGTELKAGANQLTSAAQTSAKEMPQGALKAFEKFKIIADQAPNLLTQVTDERTRAIFETARQADGSPTEQLRGAIYYYSHHNEQTEKVAQKKVTEAVADMQKKNTSWGEWGKSWFGGETPENLGALNEDIQKRAAYLVQAYHMPADMALKKSTESLKDHYTLVNGWAVPTNDKRLPPNFKTISENYIRNVVTRLGQDEVGDGERTTQAKYDAGLKKLGIDSHRDITLIDDGRGNFQLFDKKNGHPVLDQIPVDWKDENIDGRFLTPGMLQDLATFEREKSNIRALRQGAEAHDRYDAAARESKALKQGAHQLGLDQEASTRFIYNKNSVGRPAYKPPAPWLDLEAQTKNPFGKPFIYNNNSQGRPPFAPQTPLVDLEAQTKNPFGKPFIKTHNSK